MARMTISAAARALGVSPETVESYLERTGKMEDIRRGKRVYIPAEEVRALLADGASADEPEREIKEAETDVNPGNVTVPLERYESLLTELGRLRSQTEILEVYRKEAAEKDQLLLEKERRIAHLEAELGLCRISWWRRLFGR